MLQKIAEKISNEGRISVLSDTEFKKVEGYATAINTINNNSKLGNRGVVAETVIANETVTEIATLKSEHENLVANMYPNLDPVTLKADMDRKREIELQIAEKELAL